MTALDVAIYRRLIRLYPHGFWRTFHDELERDFEDASTEARGEGTGALVRFWASAATDLMLSLGREWVRTPWIPVLCAAATLSIGLFAYTASKIRRWPHTAWPASLGVDSDADSLQLIVVMVVGVLIPIVGTILGSLWALLLRSNATRRRRRV
jgi:hypothetical protein